MSGRNGKGSPRTRGKVLLNFEVSPEQRAQVHEWARAHAMTAAEYMRFKVLEHPIAREVS